MVLTGDLVDSKQRHMPSVGIVRSKVDIICNNVVFFRNRQVCKSGTTDAVTYETIKSCQHLEHPISKLFITMKIISEKLPCILNQEANPCLITRVRPELY